MRMALTLLILMWATATLAAPPLVGTIADITDPVFGNNVLCDTTDEIKSIVSAPDPIAQFSVLNATTNTVGEPTCAAVVIDAGTVTSIESIGVVRVHGHAFNGWIVGLHNGTFDVHALYLELIKESDI